MIRLTGLVAALVLCCTSFSSSWLMPTTTMMAFAFSPSPPPPHSTTTTTILASSFPNHRGMCLNEKFLNTRELSSTQLFASSKTDMRPLYDGTNYTFPDTTSPTGIAELLEVSFIHACMQLRTGHVDVLKLFIAAAVGGYEFGHSLASLEDALENCETNTAGRDLMPEELQLRSDWIKIVYFMLTKIGHPTTSVVSVDAFPDDFVESYDKLVQDIATRHVAHESIPSIETLLENDTTPDPIQKALKAQTLRVATMTLVVLQDAKESQPGGAPPPNPPIPGAFE